MDCLTASLRSQLYVYDWKVREHASIKQPPGPWGSMDDCLKISALCILGKKWKFQANMINYDLTFTKGDL